AAGEGVAVRGDDDGLRTVPQTAQDRDERVAPATALRDRDAAALQVGSCAEDGTGAGEDDDADGGVVDGTLEAASERFDHGTRERVARRGRGERDPRGTAADLVLDGLLCRHQLRSILPSAGDTSTRTASGSTICPTSTRTSRTTPSVSAASSCSIFIASSTSST